MLVRWRLFCDDGDYLVVGGRDDELWQTRLFLLCLQVGRSSDVRRRRSSGGVESSRVEARRSMPRAPTTSCSTSVSCSRLKQRNRTRDAQVKLRDHNYKEQQQSCLGSHSNGTACQRRGTMKGAIPTTPSPTSTSSGVARGESGRGSKVE